MNLFDVSKVRDIIKHILSHLTERANIKNGMANGTLSFCCYQSSQPKLIYSDQELTAPLANPVHLDSDGNCPDIFLDVSSGYEYTLRNYRNEIQVISSIEPELKYEPFAFNKD